MKIEGPGYSFKLKDGLSAEQRSEIAHTICRVLVDPPRPPPELRRVAVRTAMAQYEGSRTGRAKMLAACYRKYLASAWPRERDMESLPYPRSTERVLLHRIARLNGGDSLCWRTIYYIASSPQG